MKNLSKQTKLIVLVVAVIIGLGIWLGTKGDKKTTNNGAVNTAVQSKCQSQVNDELFCKFAGAFSAVGDYKVVADTTDQSGGSTLELATDSKGNSTMVAKKNGQEQGSVVLFNGVTYLKDPADGKWFKYAAGASGAPQILDLKKEFTKNDFNKNSDGKKVEFKKAGTEQCADLQCYKYQVIDASKPNESGFLFFDTKDYLLRKVSIKQASTSTEMTITYDTVSISEPSPTKDVPSQ